MADVRPDHTSQLKYIQVLSEAINEIPERVEGYRRALKDTIADVLALEAANRTRRTNITQRVAAKVDSLGMVLFENKWDEEDATR